MKKKILAAAVMVLFLAGCSYLPIIQRMKFKTDTVDKSQILSYYVVHNATDHLALAVKYFYAADQGECVRIGAITLKDGASDGYWAYRQDPIFPGEHWAHIRISMSEEAPGAYDTDAVQIFMYKCGSNEFQKATVPFRKHWKRVNPPLRCHLNWGKGCE